MATVSRVAATIAAHAGSHALRTSKDAKASFDNAGFLNGHSHALTDPEAFVGPAA